MKRIEAIRPYLADINELHATSNNGKNEYVHPKLKNLGCASVVLLREIIAPTVFRNLEPEITDAVVGEERRVRAVPNKFKHPERLNGLRILRHFGAGGNYPMNRHAAPDRMLPSQIFDINSLVFGDSVNVGTKVLPVKAAVDYSDGISLMPYEDCVDKSFHNRSAEDGTLFNAASKENSSALFDRYFIKPGTLLVQVITARGKILPFEGFQHLLLSIGKAGAYGGQTSVSGINIRTHIVGIYGSLIERPEMSPYLIADQVSTNDVQDAVKSIHDFVSPNQKVIIGHNEATVATASLTGKLTDADSDLAESYRKSAKAVAELFGLWFAGKAA